MSAGGRGANFERRVRACLQTDGWLVVRAAGSRGCFDLVALRQDGRGGCHVRLVQCKVRGARDFAAEDRAALRRIAEDVGATAWLASRGAAASRYAVILEPAAPEARGRPRAYRRPPGNRPNLDARSADGTRT
jgi:Holliday junction resolvase